MADIITNELSDDDSKSVELYEIIDGTTTYRYTTGADTLTITSHKWTAIPIKRSSFERTDNLLKSGVKLEVSSKTDFAKLFLSEIPERVMIVNIYSADSDVTSDKMLQFSGRIVEYEAKSSSIELNIEPIPTTASRAGFNVKYQRICRHRLYSSQCGATASKFRVISTVTSNTGLVITLASDGGKPDQHFTAGYVYADGVYRMISYHKGNNVTLIRPAPSIKVGSEIIVFAGCDLMAETCKNKFGNEANYGGFDFIPTKNPFNGVLVY